MPCFELHNTYPPQSLRRGQQTQHPSPCSTKGSRTLGSSVPFKDFPSVIFLPSGNDRRQLSFSAMSLITQHARAPTASLPEPRLSLPACVISVSFHPIPPICLSSKKSKLPSLSFPYPTCPGHLSSRTLFPQEILAIYDPPFCGCDSAGHCVFINHSCARGFSRPREKGLGIDDQKINTNKTNPTKTQRV